jgi:hypothetical protein
LIGFFGAMTGLALLMLGRRGRVFVFQKVLRTERSRIGFFLTSTTGCVNRVRVVLFFVISRVISNWFICR